MMMKKSSAHVAGRNFSTLYSFWEGNTPFLRENYKRGTVFNAFANFFSWRGGGGELRHPKVDRRTK